MKRVLFLVCLLMALIVGVVAAIFLVVLSTDVDPPDDASLTYAPPPVPAADNAHDIFCEAGESIVESLDPISYLTGPSWTAAWRAEVEVGGWDSPTAKGLVAKHVDAIELWEKGRKLPQLRVPLARDQNVSLVYLSHWRALSRLICAKAGLEAKDGRLKEAVWLVVGVIDFGRRQELAGGTMINFLVGNAVKNIGLGQLRHILENFYIEPELLIETNRRLASFHNDFSGLKDAYRVEYGMFKQTLSDLHSGKLKTEAVIDENLAGKPTPFLFKKNKTLKLVADRTQVLIDACDQRFQDRQIPDIKRKSGKDLFVRGNAIGEILFQMLMPIFDMAHRYVDRFNCGLAIARLQIAIKAFRAEHEGALPKSLDDLVPRYIDTLPDDPYARHPQHIRYCRMKQILYSVGENGTDSGGMDPEEIDALEKGEVYNPRWEQDDPSFLLHPHVPRPHPSTVTK